MYKEVSSNTGDGVNGISGMGNNRNGHDSDGNSASVTHDTLGIALDVEGGGTLDAGGGQ